MSEPMTDEELREIEEVPLLRDVPRLLAEVRRLRVEAACVRSERDLWRGRYEGAAEMQETLRRMRKAYGAELAAAGERADPPATD